MDGAYNMHVRWITIACHEGTAPLSQLIWKNRIRLTSTCVCLSESTDSSMENEIKCN
jgi:hypothetical protein